MRKHGAVTLAALFLAACSGSNAVGVDGGACGDGVCPDSGSDVRPHVGHDAGSDARSHGGTDGSTEGAVGDAGADVREAGGVDASHDAASDAPKDAEGDGGRDSSTPTGLYSATTADVYFGTNDDGNVPCGTTAAPVTFTFKNIGNASFNWSAALGPGSFTLSNPTSSTLGAGNSQTIAIASSAPIPSSSATTLDLYSDTLTITTDVPGDSPHVINLHETAYGAILGLSPAMYGFSTASGTSTTAPFSVTNNGNAPASVTLTTAETDSSGDTCFSTSPTSGTVTSSLPLGTIVTFDAPATPGIFTGTVAVTTTTGLCGPLPAAATLTGTSLAGSVAFSPSTLAFGNALGRVNCGSTAPAQSVTFTNPGTVSYSITSTLVRPSSPYTLSTTCSGGGTTTVVPGGNCVITVTPEAIPQSSAVTPNLYGDILVVTTNVSGDSPHYIPLSMTAQGAIIQAERPSLNFGAVDVGTTVTYGYEFTNVGNQPTTLGFIVSPTGAFAAPATLNATIGDTDLIPVMFTPPAASPYAASMALAVTSPTLPLCQPLPFTSVSLSGSGSSADLLLPNHSLDFGRAPCGGAAVGAQTVTITNDVAVNGMGEAVVVRASLATNNLFSLSSTSCVGTCNTLTQQLDLVFGASGMITVTPQPASQSASTQGHGLIDVITIVNNLNAEVRYVYLQETALGAVLTLTPDVLNMEPALVGRPSTVGGGFYVLNGGNLGATGLRLTPSDPSNFTLSPGGAFAAPAWGFTAATTSFVAAGAGMTSTTATLTDSNGLVGLCQSALPAAITINATGQ